jgi:hypothetical protein
MAGRQQVAGAALTLTPASLTGLFYVQRYRFLTIAQFAKLAGLRAEGQLLDRQR